MNSFTFLQEAAHRWALRCFGEKHVTNNVERSMWLVEESVELAQCYHTPKEKLHAIVDMVYSRPIGTPSQEVGGVMMTTAVLAQQNGLDARNCLQAELLRVLEKPVEAFKARNEEKAAQGFSHTAPPELVCFQKPEGGYEFRINGNRVSLEDFKRAGGQVPDPCQWDR